ncbi:MAG: hypothetical protein R2909_10080 [Gemmatimonadales bacterium]
MASIRSAPVALQVLLWSSLVGAAAFAQAPRPVTARLVAQIGEHPGGPLIGVIEALTIDGRGRLYALDADAGSVLVFDSTGALSRTLGRKGGGPGELRAPVGMALTPEGHLWVIDPGNGRLSVYGPDGAHRGDRRLVSAFQLAPWPGRIDRDGSLYHYAVDPSGGEFDFVMVRHDRSLVPRDTVRPPAPPHPPAYFESSTKRWGTVRSRVPFAPRLAWHLSPSGEVWWAWTERYEIFAGSGATSPRIAERRAAARVSPAERRAALDGLKRFRERGGRVDPSRIPDRKPAIRDFLLDDDGNVWVFPELPGEGTGRRLERFDPSGRPTHVLELPVRLSVSPAPAIRGNRLLGVALDADGAPTVVLLELPRLP